ncbi:MAG TPA: peptidoglycan DD-metalloendopeptidase family protein [Reyranella sp.]|nr:peptidoglycan DD-metalloendopeptidase family protein [Reyranella sp.]
MRLFRREAGWLVGGLCVVALGASLVAVGFLHRALERTEGEIAALRREAARQAQTEAGRSAQDQALLEQLGRELAQSSAERERAMASAEAQARIVAEQQGRIEQLAAERDTAVESAASEQARLLVDRAAVLEEMAGERLQLVRARDQAMAARDATMNETRRALRDLDAQTRTTMADVEKVIVAAGLGPSRLVPEPNRLRRVGARGGPYIPWKEQVALAEHAESAHLHALTLQVERLKSLGDVMVRLPLVAPVTHAILSDGFGYRHDPVNGGGARHEGLDLRAVRDSAVIAPAAGTVIAAGWDGAFGNLIQIDHGFGVVSRYAHLSRILVRKGDVVALNEQIGVVGATGRVTGAHLHYEIWINGQPSDPMRFITAVSRPFAGFGRQ